MCGSTGPAAMGVTSGDFCLSLVAAKTDLQTPPSVSGWSGDIMAWR